MIFMKRLGSILLMAGGWFVAAVRTMLDLIGWSTAPDDVPVFGQRLDQLLDLIFLTPWWLPWAFAFFATGLLMFVSWPRERQAIQSKVQTLAPAVDSLKSLSNESTIRDLGAAERRNLGDLTYALHATILEQYPPIIEESEKIISIWVDRDELIPNERYYKQIDSLTARLDAAYPHIGRALEANTYFSEMFDFLPPEPAGALRRALIDYREALSECGEHHSILRAYVGRIRDEKERLEHWLRTSQPALKQLAADPSKRFRQHTTGCVIDTSESNEWLNMLK